VVAHHLLERLSRGEEVPWDSYARFTPRGLVFLRQFRPSGQHAERLAAYDEGLRYRIEKDALHLFVGGEANAAMVIPCATDNFYPGLKMLDVLSASASSSAANSTSGTSAFRGSRSTSSQ
jgi:hypothetical protein